MGLTVSDLETMVPAPAASTEIQTMFATDDGVIMCYGLSAHTVLQDVAGVYAPGCIYIKCLTAGASIIYVNEGTRAAPDFDVMAVAV